MNKRQKMLAVLLAFCIATTGCTSQKGEEAADTAMVAVEQKVVAAETMELPVEQEATTVQPEVTEQTTTETQSEEVMPTRTIWVSEELLAEQNIAVPSFEFCDRESVSTNITIQKSELFVPENQGAIVGEVVEVRGEDFSEGTLTFALNEENPKQESAVLENPYVICNYQENGTIQFLDTNYDVAANCISTNIEEEGTYYVVNANKLFSDLGMELSETEIAAQQAGRVHFTASAAAAMAPADIVFVIDTTGSMGDEIKQAKDNVGAFVEHLKTKGISANLALVTYQDLSFDGEDSTVVHKNGESNWFQDMTAYQEVLSGLPLGCGGDLPESALDGLETARLLDMRASAGKAFVLITDAAYLEENRYGIPSMEAEIELLKNAGVTCTVVSATEDRSVYAELYGETGGTWLDITGDYKSHLLTIADHLGNELVGEGYWIYLQGPVPVPVRLDAKPQAGSDVDTDKDGIPDVKELKSVEPSGKIDLDELLTVASKGVITGTSYGMVEMYTYESNPTEKDSDFDGVDDSDDSSPNNSRGSGIMHYTIDGTYYKLNIEFNMDYRNLITGNNQAYGKDLSMLSVLFATDVYDTSHIEVTEFARTGGSETGTNFGDLMGLQDTRYVAVNSADYSEDKDDITDFFVGHKNIVYNGEAHEIIVVSVRGTDGTNEEWSSNFDIGADTAEYYAATGQSHPYWINKEHHKGFDVAANRVLEKLNVYINQYTNPYAKKTILVTGHSRGAAIANILGKHFEEHSEYRSYTYTFATPNTTTAANAGSYKTIFNVCNTDDIITCMPVESWGFQKYGVTKAICVEDYYENELGAAEEGSWEWFMGGTDYDNDYNTQSTLKAIAKIATTREDFYVLGSTDSEKVWEDDLGHTTQQGAEEELAELTRVLEDEKLLKFCNMYIVKNWFLYHVEINYCPAYLLQTLANMTTGVGPLLGRDVAGVYADAKTAFVASSGKVVIGGMTHPHMPPTYYIMSYHDLKSLY